MDFLRFLEELRLPVLDGLFQLLTYLGQAVPLLLLICAIYWCLNKELAARIGLSFFASGLVLQNLKIFCRIDRPWILDPGFHPVESAVPGATGYSFPSGHSQSAASFWGYLAYAHRRKKAALLFLLPVLLVGFSRMYLGCHTPKDVLGGILIGLVPVCLIDFLMNRLPNPEQVPASSFRTAKRACFLLCLSLAAVSILSAVHAFTLLSQGIISQDNAKDCITAAGSGIGFSIGWYLERIYIRFTLPESTRGKVRRYLIGIALLLVLKLLLSILFGDSLVLEMLEYGILLLYITAGYPALLSRFHKQEVQR